MLERFYPEYVFLCSFVRGLPTVDTVNEFNDTDRR